MVKKIALMLVTLAIVGMLLSPLAAQAQVKDGPVGLFGKITDINEATGEFSMMLPNGDMATFPEGTGGIYLDDIVRGDELSAVGHLAGDGFQPDSNFSVKPHESQFTHQIGLRDGEIVTGVFKSNAEQGLIPQDVKPLKQVIEDVGQNIRAGGVDGEVAGDAAIGIVEVLGQVADYLLPETANAVRAEFRAAISAAIPPQVWQELKPEDSAQMPPDAWGFVPKEGFGYIEPDSFAYVQPEAFGEIEPDAFGKMPTEAFGKINPEAFGKMPTEAFGKMAPDAFGQMNPASFSQVKPEAFSQIQPEAFGKMAPDAFGQINPMAFSQMNPDAFGNMTPEAFGKMPAEGFSQMPPQAFG